jgi:Protein of unknown function (DUF3727)/Protein of unknown function (DUF1292)
MPSSQFDSENEQYDEEVVTLVDEYNRSLDCYIEHSLESEGTTYILLLPVDSPVVIMAWDEEEEEEEVPEAVLIEEKEEIEEVFDDAKAVLAEQNLILKHTAFTLTVSGELPPIEDDKVLTLELDDEDNKLEPEELQLLATFYHEEQKYAIYTPLTPLLFFARYNLAGELELIAPEDEKLQPILEELLFEEYEN